MLKIVLLALRGLIWWKNNGDLGSLEYSTLNKDKITNFYGLKVNKNENYTITIMSKISCLATAWNTVPGNVFCSGSGYHGKKGKNKLSDFKIETKIGFYRTS